MTRSILLYSIDEPSEDERIEKIRKKIKSLLESLGDERKALERFSETPRKWKFEEKKKNYRVELKIGKIPGSNKKIVRGFCVYWKEKGISPGFPFEIAILTISYQETLGWSFSILEGDDILSWVEEHLDEILEDIRRIMERFILLAL